MKSAETRGPIGGLIATRPLWWPRYMEQALTDPAAIDALPFIFSRLRLSPDDEQGRGFLSTGIAALIRAGRYADALAVYRDAMHRFEPAGSMLRGGTFKRDPILPPFDWQLADGPDVSALIQGGAGGKRALFAVPTEGARGEVARKLLLLSAGRYRLVFRAGNVPAAGLQLTLKLQCIAGTRSQDRETQQIAPSPDAGRAGTLAFVVPANGCAAQWIIVSVDNAGAVPEALPWLNDLRIERSPA